MRPPRYAVEPRFDSTTLKYRVGWSPHTGFYAVADEALGADAAGAQVSE
jgi:hypothetical protein